MTTEKDKPIGYYAVKRLLLAKGDGLYLSQLWAFYERLLAKQIPDAKERADYLTVNRRADYNALKKALGDLARRGIVKVQRYARKNKYLIPPDTMFETNANLYLNGHDTGSENQVTDGREVTKSVTALNTRSPEASVPILGVYPNGQRLPLPGNKLEYKQTTLDLEPDSAHEAKVISGAIAARRFRISRCRWTAAIVKNEQGKPSLSLQQFGKAQKKPMGPRDNPTWWKWVYTKELSNCIVRLVQNIDVYVIELVDVRDLTGSWCRDGKWIEAGNPWAVLPAVESEVNQWLDHLEDLLPAGATTFCGRLKLDVSAGSGLEIEYYDENAGVWLELKLTAPKEKYAFIYNHSLLGFTDRSGTDADHGHNDPLAVQHAVHAGEFAHSSLNVGLKVDRRVGELERDVGELKRKLDNLNFNVGELRQERQEQQRLDVEVSGSIVDALNELVTDARRGGR